MFARQCMCKVCQASIKRPRFPRGEIARPPLDLAYALTPALHATCFLSYCRQC
ncbi:hypothetical protein BC832DRAFT_558397 [Gaertneriomyces semiglobifer]|nr:hypothetical protein BC832DRAFT_558397 [Gaertneriomyces semiglobifer]